MAKRFRTFQEFWPYYLSEHSKRGTRVFHFVGTTLLWIFLVQAFRRSSFVYLAAGVIAGYGFAWAGHFLIEKNRPATFVYPLFSLLGDFKMYALILTRGITRELQRIVPAERVS
ncbi:MAG TPA: DUF962 domain-containing protein [Acidobacteriota bacterium]|nr:DUF962 domain-containing protein [Acidobacteriota bacterium]